MNTNVLVHTLDQASHWAWSSSLAICVPALMLLVLGCWKGFPVRWRIVLSVAVALRLVLPAVPGLPGHPFGWVRTPINAVDASASVMVAAGDVAATAAATTSTSPWVWLWLAGVVVTLGWTLASHILLKRRLQAVSDHPGAHLESLLAWCCRRAQVTASIDFRLVHGLSTPAIYGWRTPMLLLPADIEARHTDDEICGMMLHELVHIRQGDGFWNWAGLAVCALHWFNPFVWLCLRRYHADREIVCDQRALDLLSPQQRHAYGHALLKTWETVSSHQPALLTPFLRRRTETYTRILMSIQPTRQHRVVQLLAIVLVPALSLVSLTTVRADREPGKKPAESEEGKASAEGEREGGAEKSKSRRTRERDGAKKEGDRDGAGKEGARDGVRKEGDRDGAGRKPGMRDGEGARKGPRDGEGGSRKGPRDGEGEKKGPRDGDTKKTGPRDGETKRTGPRDGDKPKGEREGDGARKTGPRDGEGAPKEGEGDKK